MIHPDAPRSIVMRTNDTVCKRFATTAMAGRAAAKSIARDRLPALALQHVRVTHVHR